MFPQLRVPSVQSGGAPGKYLSNPRFTIYTHLGNAERSYQTRNPVIRNVLVFIPVGLAAFALRIAMRQSFEYVTCLIAIR